MGADVNAFTDMLDSLIFSSARTSVCLCPTESIRDSWDVHPSQNHLSGTVTYLACMCACIHTCMCMCKNVCVWFPAVAEERIPHCPQRQTQQRHKGESCLRERREKGSSRDGGKNCEGERKLKMNLRDGVQMVANGLEKQNK